MDLNGLDKFHPPSVKSKPIMNHLSILPPLFNKLYNNNNKQKKKKLTIAISQMPPKKPTLLLNPTLMIQICLIDLVLHTCFIIDEPPT